MVYAGILYGIVYYGVCWYTVYRVASYMIWCGRTILHVMVYDIVCPRI